MPFDKLKLPEELAKERRKAVLESLQPVSVDELKKVLKEHEEEFVGDPWRDEFERLIEAQPHASYYRAVPQDGVVIYYCRDTDFGVWVLEGSGMGPLDATSKSHIKEAIGGGLAGRKIGETK